MTTDKVECSACGAYLVFSSRNRGDGMCGPCSRESERVHREATAPFRDLFVELPHALIEVLRAVVDDAVTKRPEPAPPTTLRSASASDWHESIIAMIRRRYRLRRLVMQRSASDRVHDVTALLGCGHLNRFTIPDAYLFDGERSSQFERILDALDDGFAKRLCFCVQRQ